MQQFILQPGVVDCEEAMMSRTKRREEVIVATSEFTPNASFGCAAGKYGVPNKLYMVSQLLVDLGCVDLVFESSTVPDSAWDNRNLAEMARQLSKMVEHPNQSQLNPGPR